MGKPIFLLFGGNQLNFGVLNKFQKKGYLVYVIDWNEHPQMTGDRHYRLDVKYAGPIIEALKRDGSWPDVKFGYTSIDLAVPALAKVHRALGLKTISDSGLENSSSKCRMTARWRELGLLNREARQYRHCEDSVFELSKRMDIIIKPDNSASSRGITIITRGTAGDEVRRAFEKAQAEASDRLVTVEEFVVGREYTVEMLGDADGHVSVYAVSRKTHTENAVRNKIAVKLHYNCEPDDLQRKIADYAVRCYKALGFSCSLGHLEILLKPDGTLSPVEIGARSSGCIASDLVDIVSGRDFLKDWFDVLNGGSVPDGLRPQSTRSSMFFFYDLPAGARIVRRCNLLDFTDEAVSSRFWDRSRLTEGYQVPLIGSDNERIGYEILEGPKSLMTVEYIKEAEQKMLEAMVGRQ